MSCSSEASKSRSGRATSLVNAAEFAALLHDIGKGWPGDHRVTGEVVSRDTTRRMGLAEADTELVASAVRHHLLIPHMATRRDLDDPETVAQVTAVVGSTPLLEMLHALAIADGQATGPAAWNDWKAVSYTHLTLPTN